MDLMLDNYRVERYGIYKGSEVIRLVPKDAPPMSESDREIRFNEFVEKYELAQQQQNTGAPPPIEDDWVSLFK